MNALQTPYYGGIGGEIFTPSPPLFSSNKAEGFYSPAAAAAAHYSNI